MVMSPRLQTYKAWSASPTKLRLQFIHLMLLPNEVTRHSGFPSVRFPSSFFLHVFGSLASLFVFYCCYLCLSFSSFRPMPLPKTQSNSPNQVTQNINSLNINKSPRSCGLETLPRKYQITNYTRIAPPPTPFDRAVASSRRVFHHVLPDY